MQSDIGCDREGETMFEIPFVSKDVLVGDDKRRAASMTARMAQMVTIASKLMEAGWCVEWTVTGVAFQPPYQLKLASLDAIREQVGAMGILDKVRRRASRDLRDVVAAQAEYADRAWYVDLSKDVRVYGELGDPCLENFVHEMVHDMSVLEGLYTRRDLSVDNDYERGIVKGRHQTFEWLLGAEWPVVEEEQEELAEEERAEIRAKRTIDGVHHLLFGCEEVPESGQSLADAQANHEEMAQPQRIER